MLIIGIIIMVAATLVVIGLPFVQQDLSSEEPPKVDFTLAELEEEKEKAYLAVKEAEFDFETGKLSEEDYNAVREKYSSEAVRIIKEIETHEKNEASKPENVDKAISVEGSFCSKCGAKIESGAKFCKGCGLSLAAKQSNLCPNCGNKFDKNSKFCAKCGTGLS